MSLFYGDIHLSLEMTHPEMCVCMKGGHICQQLTN